MDDSIGANTALLLETGGPIYDIAWGGNTNYGKFILGFSYDKTSGTATTVRAEADNCKNKDPDNGREMDRNRASPNKDDRSWSY